MTLEQIQWSWLSNEIERRRYDLRIPFSEVDRINNRVRGSRSNEYFWLTSESAGMQGTTAVHVGLGLVLERLDRDLAG